MGGASIAERTRVRRRARVRRSGHGARCGAGRADARRGGGARRGAGDRRARDSSAVPRAADRGDAAVRFRALSGPLRRSGRRQRGRDARAVVRHRRGSIPVAQRGPGAGAHRVVLPRNAGTGQRRHRVGGRARAVDLSRAAWRPRAALGDDRRREGRGRLRLGPAARSAPGVQDRLSAAVRLALLRRSRPALFRPARRSMPMLGSSNVESVGWRVLGEEPVTTDAGVVRAMRLSRAGTSEDDPAIDVWLALDARIVPVRMRITEPSGRALDQVLASQ
ncbi:MAG: DUF3108 domain-containing protein [Burkholderiaceae bacterium]